MSINKNELREYFQKKRQNISESKKCKFSQNITNTLSELFSTFQKKEEFSGHIALFAGTEDEPNILNLLQKFPDQKFCFPRVSQKNEDENKGKMDFFLVSSKDDLEKGSFGILEPRNFCKKVSHFDISLFCIPALSIDKKGNRLGVGGGFYDRYLSKVSQEIIKIGVIFSCQIMEENFLEDMREDFDIPVDMVVTEEDRIITPNYSLVYSL